MVETSNSDLMSRLAVAESVAASADHQRDKMQVTLSEVRDASITTNAALRRIEERLGDGQTRFEGLTTRVGALEVAHIEFQASKNILLMVAAAFGAIVTFLASIVMSWLHLKA